MLGFAHRGAARRTGAAVTAVLVITSLLAPSTPAAALPDAGWPSAERPPLLHPDLARSLEDEAAGRPAFATGAASADRDGDGRATVVVEATDASAGRRAVEAVGGAVRIETATLVEAEVPSSRLVELASASGVHRVREPRPVRMDVESEGVAETDGEVWQTAGWAGTGTTVAVLDGGFSGYVDLLGSELPGSVETDFSRCGGSPGASEHGTAVAEIVHDMAPGATLRLICVQTDTGFIDALDDLPAAVDIVNASIGFTLVGRGDGTGGVGAAVGRARDRGVLFVTSAGNLEGRHFHMAAVGDTPGDDDADFVNLPGDDALAFAVAPGDFVDVELQWDGWPTTTQDFDLYVYDDSSVPVAASFEDQSSGGLAPIEWVRVNNPSGVERVYFVVIDRFAGTASPRLDLYFHEALTGLEASTSSSVADPGTAPGAFTIGAHCWQSGAVESFSSRGPTIDGRIKPDISGPDGTASSVYGSDSGCNGPDGFYGTSASSPHVAGAAALVLGASPDLDVAELQQLLEDRAQDAGPAGKDTTYGSGRLRLGSAGDATLPAPQAYSPRDPVRLFDSRPGVVGVSESPDRTTKLGPGGKVRVQVAGIAGVPADATAVILNVTATQPTAAGWLTVHPGGSVPNASNLNFTAGQTAAVHVTATVAADEKIELVNALGSTHVIVDLAGWYGPTGPGGPATDLLHVLPAPARAIDTREGTPGYAEGEFGPEGATAPLGPDGLVNVQVAGLGGVPANATGVVLNVTVTQPSAKSWIVAYPNGAAAPGTSALNMVAGQTVANLVVVPVGTDGRVRFGNQLGSTHLVVDTIGWFAPGAGGAGYLALDPPTRDLDTRTGTGLRRTPLGTGQIHHLKVARYDGVPADAVAVMLGVVAVTPSKAGWLTIFPGGQAVPTASNINFPAGATTPNAVVAGMGNGTVAFRNQTGSTHLVSDLFGYFIDAADQPVPLPVPP